MLAKIILPPDIRQAAAYHEAGHAVIALALQIPIRRISIISEFEADLDYPPDLAVGDSIPTPPNLIGRFGNTSFVPVWTHKLDELVMLFAGLLSERRLNLTLPQAMCNEATDVERISALFEEMSLTDKQLEWCFFQATEILRTNWAAVEIIAAMLLARGVVYGSELFVTGPPPESPSLTSLAK